MAHDFLVSLHSSVIKTGGESSPEKPMREEEKQRGRPAKIGDETKHRTVGVSMSPQLRDRAANRAKNLGLPFSRYVQWCIEAELDGSSLSDRFKT
jgi:hypothetical protein